MQHEIRNWCNGTAQFLIYGQWIGRAIAQAVSRWLPTAAVRVCTRVWSSEICGGQSGAGAGYRRVLWFPLPIFIPPNSPSSQSSRAGAIGQKWPTCQVDPVWTSPPTIRIKKKWSLDHSLTELIVCVSAPNAGSYLTYDR
jgi:hypothetical protein